MFDLIAGLGPAADPRTVESLDSSFLYNLPHFDQTMTPVGEAGIEFVVRKRPREEVARGGRLPLPGVTTAEAQLVRLLRNR